MPDISFVPFAAIVATNTAYVVLTFIPPVVWLLFYLREDRHPEPRHLLILTFVGGIASAFAALLIESQLIGPGGLLPIEYDLADPGNALLIFLVIGFVEEYMKYLSVKFLIQRRPDFDEPIDAMIYMMTAALGFAAIENTLFVFPLFHYNASFGLEVTADRFLGANLLHALASGIVGFFLARAWFHPRRRHFIAIGLFLATILHAGFNYLISLQSNIPESTLYIILLLSVMGIAVLIDFERLKREGT